MKTEAPAFRFAILVPEQVVAEITDGIRQRLGDTSFKHKTEPVTEQESTLKSDIGQLIPQIWYYLSVAGDAPRDIVIGLVTSFIYDTIRGTPQKSEAPATRYLLPVRLPNGKLIYLDGSDPATVAELRDALEPKANP
jgi:hypothetical protein